MEHKLYIVLYHHRHGTDAWPVCGNTPPDLDEQAKMVDFEPDREDEWLETVGPFDLDKLAIAA